MSQKLISTMLSGKVVYSDKALQTATEKRIENANLKAARLKPILERVNPDGYLSLHRVAKALNQEEIPTMSGKGQWNAKSVQRVYKRLAA